jgi:hypothetical protein
MKAPTSVWNSQWTAGWTSMVVFQQGAQSYLLSYKSATGQVAIDRFHPDGTGTDTVWNSQWTAGWTSMVVFQQGAQSYLLSYKSATGQVATDALPM